MPDKGHRDQCECECVGHDVNFNCVDDVMLCDRKSLSFYTLSAPCFRSLRLKSGTQVLLYINIEMVYFLDSFHLLQRDADVLTPSRLALIDCLQSVQS